MKKIWTIFPALLLTLALTACGAGASAPAAAAPTAEPAAAAAAETATPAPAPTVTPEPTAEPEATELTAGLTVTASNNEGTARLTDGKLNTRCRYDAEESVSVASEEPVYSVYLVWNQAPGEYQIDVGDRVFTGGQTGGTSEYIDFAEPVTSFKITFFQHVEFVELRAFSDGTLPAGVEG